MSGPGPWTTPVDPSLPGPTPVELGRPESTRLVAGGLVRLALGGGGPLGVPHLVVRREGQPERLVPLPAELTVGRGPEAGLALQDPGASRRHLRLRLDAGGGAEVVDLGSKNGLLLNGRRLGPRAAALRHGDRLTVGTTELCFQDPPAGPAPAAPPGAARPRRGAGLAPWALLLSAGLLGLAAAAMAALG